MLNKKRIKNKLRANILKALANFTRVCIIEHLQNGPMNVTDLAENIGESNSITSRHLTILKNTGLIGDTKTGTKVTYSLTTDIIPDILKSVDEVIKNNYEQYKIFFSSKD